MTVAFDSNGNPYDVDTNQPVSLVYDGSGNAIDANTGTLVDQVISPNQQTVYSQASNPTGWSQTVQQLLLNATSPSPYSAGYPGYQPYYTPMTAYPTPYSSTYPPGYRPPPTGVTAGVGSSGLGFNVSPMILIVGAVVLFAFFSGKGRRS
jgi:hypothetical protein